MNPDIQKMANEAKSAIIPKISKPMYDKTYKSFVNWRKERNCADNKIEDQLLAYFAEHLATPYEGKNRAPSSLWPLRSMLITCLNAYENVDISRIKSLTAFIKNACVGYQPKKSHALTIAQVDQFLTTADDHSFLHIKVILTKFYFYYKMTNPS